MKKKDLLVVLEFSPLHVTSPCRPPHGSRDPQLYITHLPRFLLKLAKLRDWETLGGAGRA